LAIATLSSIGPDARECLAAIAEQLDNPDPNVRWWGSQALKNIGAGTEKEEQ
jgi:hypothetical protein